MNFRRGTPVTWPLLVLALSCAALLVITSCSSSDDPEGDDPVGVNDTNAPVITITSPTPGAVGTGGVWTFTGTTGDTKAVATITWDTSTGNSGTVTSELAEWTAEVDLGHGDVDVLFTVTDGAGNSATAEVSVVSNYYFELTQPTQISPNATITDEATYLLVYAAVDPGSLGSDDERTFDSLELVLMGTEETVLSTLTDDGNLDNADEINGDNVFSTSVQHTFVTAGDARLRVRASYTLADGATVVEDFGAITELTVVAGVDSDQLAHAAQVGSNGWDIADDLIEGGATIAEAAAQTVVQLEEDPDVVSAATSDDGYVVWYETSAGLRGNILLNPEGTRGGGGGAGQSERGGDLIAGPYAWELPSAKIEEVSSNNVIIFDAYNSQFAPFDEAPFLRDLFEDSECPLFEVDYFADTDCTVDVVSTFDQYGTIILVTHGGRQDGEVFFMTRQTATAGLLDEHEVDLILDNLTLTTVGGEQIFSILPGFIEDLGLFPESVVYNGSCESSANNTMADAFLNNGATAYLGFTRVVNSDFAQTVSQVFFTEMVTNGDDSDEAFTAGQVDPGDPHATFTLNSNDDAVYNSEFVNASFEEGDLSGWTKAGDGRVITALGSTLPTDGAYMGIISTGLGFTTDSGSISAAICSFSEDAPAATLYFDWNFFSEEFLEYCNSQYQDFFEVAVIIEGTETILMYEWIDNLCASVSPSDVVFDQGDVYDTGWQSASFTLPAIMAGQSVIISFRAGDVGDSIYDSAILIDDVRLE